jgi:hypothetical protein
MTQSHSLDTEALTKTTVGVDDMTPGAIHGNFATVVFRMEDSIDPESRAPQVKFDPHLWARVAPMLAAPLLLEALKSALQWHRGDKWRDSDNERERSAWRAQHDLLETALKEADKPAPWINL